MTELFEEYTYSEVKDVHFPDRSTLADWKQFWGDERLAWQQADGRALVHVYYNGKARKSKDNKREYWW